MEDKTERLPIADYMYQLLETQGIRGVRNYAQTSIKNFGGCVNFYESSEIKEKVAQIVETFEGMRTTLTDSRIVRNAVGIELLMASGYDNKQMEALIPFFKNSAPKTLTAVLSAKIKIK